MVWRKLLKVGLVLIVVLVWLGAVYVMPVLNIEIDPNIGKPECPGGKDWDLRGSSCHGGTIIDYSPMESSGKKPVRAKTSASTKRKRG